MVKEKTDIRPVLFKFGVALTLSLGGILCSFIRTRWIRPSAPPPSPRYSDCGNQVDSAGERATQKHNPVLQTSPSSISPQKHGEQCFLKVTVDNSSTSLSPRGRSNGCKDGFLLPEFDELVNVLDLCSTKAYISPRKDVETPKLNIEMLKGCKSVDTNYHELEIENLRHMVEILKERERILEMELLQYYGLKEQETVVMELRNRLKISSMEAKLFAFKIKSLQADNRRLEVQVADYAKVLEELDAARAKMMLLKKKLRHEAEQNKEQILTLKQRVTKLQDLEPNALTSNPDILLKQQNLKDLEEEMKYLRNSNHNLQLKNSGLAQRLESVQILATSGLEREMTEESCRLRQQNEGLMKEIEQLQADHFADVEQLIYLQWINACLRYELRHYQPGPSKTTARDLCKTLSPKSEEKAKQLILEYANQKGPAERELSVADFEYEQWSSSQASSLTEPGELDDSSAATSSAKKTNASCKNKVFRKLVRIL